MGRPPWLWAQRSLGNLGNPETACWQGGGWLGGECQSPASPTLSSPGWPGGQASPPASIHLVDTDGVPHSVSLPLALQEQRSRGLP